MLDVDVTFLLMVSLVITVECPYCEDWQMIRKTNIRTENILDLLWVVGINVVKACITHWTCHCTDRLFKLHAV